MRQTLEQWLDYIGGLHPIKWDLTLDRVAEVARRLGVVQPARRVILVAGTNGKGSCCEALAALATGAGVSFGVTTSPHLRHFNERIQINGAEATDLQIVSAFEQIELARSDISLSYFEFACLAALLLFKEADLDLAILEIGLGGRLDAMNLVDPDISVILPIALDHQSYLGDTLEAIGLEKAGILRPNGTLVLADRDPPNSILAEAARQRCQVKRIGREFDWADGEVSWMAAELQQSLTLPSAETSLPNGSLAAAVQAMAELGLLNPNSVGQLCNVSLLGRLTRLDLAGQCVYLDVAHNPHAVVRLAAELSRRGCPSIRVVFGLYADKDVQSIIAAIGPMVHFWHLTQVSEARALPVEQLMACLPLADQARAESTVSVQQALENAIRSSVGTDTIVVFGSFPVVGEALEYLDRQSSAR
ncbi:MAG: bifunctional folylpolyglutamate synthase/dihydrofolate synthase [Gammaproteobacteria bacterium]|jgi:dihydrofolate synthase/folylpolyglutamate synthase|nr:bifunctional folylpolyglutamate synthase/dihydrofolate synthase [Gammaproteobacteria bacterium]